MLPTGSPEKSPEIDAGLAILLLQETTSESIESFITVWQAFLLL